MSSGHGAKCACVARERESGRQRPGDVGQPAKCRSGSLAHVTWRAVARRGTAAAGGSPSSCQPTCGRSSPRPSRSLAEQMRSCQRPFPPASAGAGRRPASWKERRYVGRSVGRPSSGCLLAAHEQHRVRCGAEAESGWSIAAAETRPRCLPSALPPSSPARVKTHVALARRAPHQRQKTLPAKSKI